MVLPLPFWIAMTGISLQRCVRECPGVLRVTEVAQIIIHSLSVSKPLENASHLVLIL